VDTEGGTAAAAAAPRRTDQWASTAPPNGGGMPGCSAALARPQTRVSLRSEGWELLGFGEAGHAVEWPRAVSEEWRRGVEGKGREAKLRACAVAGLG